MPNDIVKFMRRRNVHQFFIAPSKAEISIFPLPKLKAPKHLKTERSMFRFDFIFILVFIGLLIRRTIIEEINCSFLLCRNNCSHVLIGTSAIVRYMCCTIPSDSRCLFRRLLHSAHRFTAYSFKGSTSCRIHDYRTVMIGGCFHQRSRRVLLNF